MNDDLHKARSQIDYVFQIVAHLTFTHCRALHSKCQLTGWSVFDNLFILCLIRMFNIHYQAR